MWSAEKYIDDVVAGRVVACHWVQQAAQRHIDDLREGGQRGLVFDRDAAEHALKFFTILKHSKGEWAGRPIELEPWQQFLLWVLFGWKKDDGTRRFRTAYIEVARKNGKSTLGAGVGLYLLAADGEPGAEIYSAATKRDQARITHLEAVRMVRASPMLRMSQPRFLLAKTCPPAILCLSNSRSFPSGKGAFPPWRRQSAVLLVRRSAATPPRNSLISLPERKIPAFRLGNCSFPSGASG